MGCLDSIESVSNGQGFCLETDETLRENLERTDSSWVREFALFGCTVGRAKIIFSRRELGAQWNFRPLFSPPINFILRAFFAPQKTGSWTLETARHRNLLLESFVFAYSASDT